MKKFYYVLIAFGFAVTGCETREDQISSDVKSEKTSILTFSSFRAFSDSANIHFAMPRNDQETWESTKGFNSLQKLFRKVQLEEEQNYESENKLFDADPTKVGEHEKSATGRLIADMIYYNEVQGGVQLNVSDPRFATLLNKDGMAKIGNKLFQFTYGFTKSKLLSGDLSADIVALKAATRTRDDQHIYVYEVKHTVRPLNIEQNSNARLLDYNYVRSCENANGSQYRVIGYIDEIEGTSYAPCDNNGVCYAAQVEYKYASVLITIRTLKRGAFGAWYDRGSSFQSANGSFYVTGNIPSSNDWLSPAIAGGTSRPFNIFTPYSFNFSNSSGETATWQSYLFLSEPSDFTNPFDRTSNVRLASGSSITINWNGEYNCHCNVNY